MKAFSSATAHHLSAARDDRWILAWRRTKPHGAPRDSQRSGGRADLRKREISGSEHPYPGAHPYGT